MKKIKLYEKINYKGLDWFVTKVYDDKLTLMLADRLPDEIILKVFDSSMLDRDLDVKFDDETIDWYDSYVKQKLHNEFLKILNIDRKDLCVMITNYAEEELVTDLVRIPTLKECRELPKNIICRNSIWSFWLMNKGVNKTLFNTGVFAFSRDTGGASGTYSFRVVRPVITVLADRLDRGVEDD